jgi:hypothetical protein
MSESEEMVAEDIDHMIAQAERRQSALREHRRVAVQNWEILAQDYAVLVEGLNRDIEQNGLVIHRLHSMKLGREAEPPMGPTIAKKERSEEQERLRKEFEKGQAAEKTSKVVPPDYAVEGDLATTWTYQAPKDWSPADKIDENNVRHVQAIACSEGHFNPRHLPDGKCLTCKVPIEIKNVDRYTRTYDMASGHLIGSVKTAQAIKDVIPENGVPS